MTQQTPERERERDSAALQAALLGYLAAQQHRNSQLRVRAGYMQEFFDLWPLLDKASASTSVDRWLRLNVALVRRWQQPARSLAMEFYRAQRAARIEGRGVSLPQPPEMPEQQIVRNLLDRGPRVLRRARLVGLGEVEAEERAEAAAAASGGRMVLEAGRSAVERSGKSERVAVGFMRVTDGDPCYFCAMVAARGAVFESEATAGLDANLRFMGEGMHKYHDNCGCTVSPIFQRSDFISPEGDKYRAIWKRSTEGLTGDDARRAFRAEMEGREFTGARNAGSTSRNRATGSSQALGFDNLTREQLEIQIGILKGLPDTSYKADTLAKYRARLSAL